MTRTRVALLTAGDPERMTGGYLYHRRMADAAAAHGADVAFVSIPDLPLAWALPTGVWWARARALRRADVVVLDSIAAAAAAPWLGAFRAPVLGMLHQLPGGMESHPVARGVRARFDRWAYRGAGLLMVASEWLAAELVRAGVDHRRLRLVRPGKDATFAVQAHADHPAETAAPGGRVRGEARADLRRGRRIAVLCVANWVPRKGIVELLDALGALPDELVTLHLVGDTTAGGGYRREVRARAHSPDLRNRVVVHGIVPPAAVDAMYRSVDAFALVSFEEPYGTVWGEAMAAGLPVIGWRAGNLPFLAEDEREALLVPTGDVRALTEAIGRIARDPDLRARIGRAAARRAAERPTWAETADTFFAVIEEARARGGRR